MCGRFTIAVSVDELAELLGVLLAPNPVPRPDAFPSQPVLAVRLDAAGRREIATFRWGLMPHWADSTMARKLINARCETLREKPAFRDAFKHRRCLIPADSFLEWKAEGRRKLPYRFHRPDGWAFLFAGLWEPGRRHDETTAGTCTIVTTDGNGTVRPIHDRMPVILTAETASRWLAPGPLTPDEAAELFVPVPDDFLIAERVPERLNNPRAVERRSLERTPSRGLFDEAGERP